MPNCSELSTARDYFFPKQAGRGDVDVTYTSGLHLIDDVASWEELESAVEEADRDTQRAVITRALEDLLATDDAIIAEHIHSALFATSLRRLLPMPAEWERDDPRFVRHAELWLCVHAPDMDAARLGRTLERALGTNWEPLDDGVAGTPEQKYAALLGDLVVRLSRAPQHGTAELLERLAERAPMLYASAAKDAAQRAPRGSRRWGRERASGAVTAIWKRLMRSLERSNIARGRSAPSPAGASGEPTGLGPYRSAVRSGPPTERPPSAGAAAWLKLAGVLDVGERGVLRALRADPRSLLDRWQTITEHAKRPRAGCYCTQPRPETDALRDAPCGMRAVRTLHDQPGTAVVFECPHTRLRWIRHELPEMPDGTYGAHRKLAAQVVVDTDPETRVLELAYVVKGWIERPATVVVRLVETWERAGHPAAELPTEEA